VHSYESSRMYASHHICTSLTTCASHAQLFKPCVTEWRENQRECLHSWWRNAIVKGISTSQLHRWHYRIPIWLWSLSFENSARFMSVLIVHISSLITRPIHKYDAHKEMSWFTQYVRVIWREHIQL